MPNNQKIQNGQQDSRIQTVAEQSSRTIVSGVERNTTLDESQLRSSGQNVAPEYRMPPLYGEEQSSSQTQQPANLQTHSSKFPVSVFEYIYTHEHGGVSNFLEETVITKLYRDQYTDIKPTKYKLCILFKCNISFSRFVKPCFANFRSNRVN